MSPKLARALLLGLAALDLPPLVVTALASLVVVAAVGRHLVDLVRAVRAAPVITPSVRLPADGVTASPRPSSPTATASGPVGRDAAGSSVSG